jgi:ABC-type bacteriocin/lantibiotic exporter with double-glycine peptidase domain
MSERAAALTGMELPRATWRLLSECGLEESYAAFRDSWPLSEGAADVIAPLLQHGQPARLVQLQPGDLARLALPAAVETRSGWLVLWRRERGGYVTEGEDETRLLPLSQLEPVLAGPALEPVAALPASGGLWKRLRPLLADYRGALVQIGLASLLLQLLTLAAPELTSLALGRALPDGAGSLLNLLALGVFAAALLRAAATWLRERAVLYVLGRVEVALRRGLLDHVLRLPYAYLQKQGLGELLQPFQAVAGLRGLFAERALGALLDLPLLLVCAVAMALKLPAQTLALLLAAALMTLLSLIVGRYQARQQQAEVEAQAQQRGYLTELINGAQTVKAAGAEAAGLARWSARFARELRHVLWRQRAGLWIEVGVTALRQGLTALVLIWGAAAVLAGELALGAFFAFLMLSDAFLRALGNCLDSWLIFALLKPQLQPVQDLLAQTAQLRAPAAARRGRQPVEIVLEDVWFRYAPDAPWVLQGYNLRVEAGELASISGHSGMGKSTILRLIAGLYEPQRGAVSIGGLKPAAARNRLIYLPQFVQLYGGSLMDNLRLLSAGASHERLLAAAARTGLHALAGSLPMGYQTPMNQGGRSFSGGQRQLIALTALLAADREILLLDEPLANIDPLSHHPLTELLREDGRTIVCAAHT